MRHLHAVATGAGEASLKTGFDVGDVAVIKTVAVGSRLLRRAVAVRSFDVHDDDDGEEEEEDADGQDGAGDDGERRRGFSRRRLSHLVRIDDREHSAVFFAGPERHDGAVLAPAFGGLAAGLEAVFAVGSQLAEDELLFWSGDSSYVFFVTSLRREKGEKSATDYLNDLFACY